MWHTENESNVSAQRVSAAKIKPYTCTILRQWGSTPWGDPSPWQSFLDQGHCLYYTHRLKIPEFFSFAFYELQQCMSHFTSYLTCHFPSYIEYAQPHKEEAKPELFLISQLCLFWANQSYWHLLGLNPDFVNNPFGQICSVKDHGLLHHWRLTNAF